MDCHVYELVLKWIGEHPEDAIGIFIALIGWLAKVTWDSRRNKRDIDKIAELIPTKRAMARVKRAITKRGRRS